GPGPTSAPGSSPTPHRTTAAVRRGRRRRTPLPGHTTRPPASWTPTTPSPPHRIAHRASDSTSRTPPPPADPGVQHGDHIHNRLPRSASSGRFGRVVWACGSEWCMLSLVRLGWVAQLLVDLDEFVAEVLPSTQRRNRRGW